MVFHEQAALALLLIEQARGKNEWNVRSTDAFTHVSRVGLPQANRRRFARAGLGAEMDYAVLADVLPGRAALRYTSAERLFADMVSAMAEYELYCFAQSGNAYRVALMLNLIGADWRPIFVDFFGKGETRTEEYRTKVNEMGEAPVLVHGERKLSQSAVCLTYLAERSGKFQPQGKDEERETLRWMISTTRKSAAFSAPIAS